MNTAIQIDELGQSYQQGTWVFRHVNAQIEQGCVCAILGPNGCGKTTLLRALLGHITPREGVIRTCGRMAYVPQLFQSDFAYTTLEMVLMGRVAQIGLFAQPSIHDIEIGMQALEHFEIAHLAHRPFKQLSGGERQLAIFARALSSNAKILLLDEPTSALDLKHQILVLHWVERLAQEEKMTILFTTHHPGHAYALATHALLMLPVSIYGSTEQVLTEDRLHELYGADLRFTEVEHKGKVRRMLVPLY